MKWYRQQSNTILEVNNNHQNNNGNHLKKSNDGLQYFAVHHSILCWLIFLPLSGILAVAICRMVSLNGWISIMITAENYMPLALVRGVRYMFPLDEMASAYNSVLQFVPMDIFHAQMKHLMFITFHIQVGMGYLGIAFLTKEQMRRNELVRLEDKEILQEVDLDDRESKQKKSKKLVKKIQQNVERARKFRWSALPFIFLTATPYMMQLIIFGGLNEYSYNCFRDDMHRAVRLNKMFEHDSHIVAMSMDSTLNPGGKKNDVFVYYFFECFHNLVSFHLYEFSRGSEHGYSDNNCIRYFQSKTVQFAQIDSHSIYNGTWADVDR